MDTSVIKDFLASPNGKKLMVVLTAGLAAVLSSKFPMFEKYVDLAAAFTAGGALMRSPGDVRPAPAPKEES